MEWCILENTYMCKICYENYYHIYIKWRLGFFKPSIKIKIVALLWILLFYDFSNSGQNLAGVENCIYFHVKSISLLSQLVNDCLRFDLWSIGISWTFLQESLHLSSKVTVLYVVIPNSPYVALFNSSFYVCFTLYVLSFATSTSLWLPYKGYF